MFLYFVRHGEPKSKEDDPERPLSEKGVQDIQRIAIHLCKMSVNVRSIFHSGKLRAKQTAEIISRELRPVEGVLEEQGLSPLDDPGIWVDRLSHMDDNCMLAGHMPHLGKLAYHLLSGSGEEGDVMFSAGQVACLKKDENGKWELQWTVSPDEIS